MLTSALRARMPFAGMRNGWTQEFAEILAGHPPGCLSPYSLAVVYAVRGDADRATSYLHQSADLREATILLLKVERAFDRVRQDERFLALERQIGLL